ncbi:MAG: hypothetical protein V3U88_08480 [Methylococcales bacterium]
MADNQDKTLALLGIAATKKSPDQECPPENIMSAFIEDHLDSEMRTKMLAHVNQCEDCYFTWEQTSLFLAQHQVKVAELIKTPKVGILQRLKSWLDSGFSWQVALPGLSLAALAIAMVVNLPDSDTGFSDPSIAATKALDADTLARKINQFPVPWKDQRFGFNKSAYTAPAKAFGVGLWDVRRSLINSDEPLPVQLESEPAINWRNSAYHDYYAYGQWALDAWLLAKAKHVKPQQWAVLKQSLQTLETGLKQRQQFEPEATIALKNIGTIKTSLDRLSQKVHPSLQTALLRDIEHGVQTLFL